MTDDIRDLDETTDEESFAELFEQSYKDAGRLEPGQKVNARILAISGDCVFLDTGRKGEGVLDRKELLDAEGNLTVQEGDSITAWFVSSNKNEMRFTTKISGSAAGRSLVEDAWQAGIPVDGFVEKEVKGGFEVKVAGSIRAFCPFSQSGLRRGAPSDQFVGKHLSFKITEYGERGRNIVLSHRAILDEQRKEQMESLKGSLSEGMTVTGTVTSVRDFGAFVAAAGIEGLVPISEASWGRVKDLRDVLSPGQEVTVVIKRLDWDAQKFSFSIKEALPNPWVSAVENLPVGSYQKGVVARLTAFGAFVTLADGVDGLIHISKLGAGKRIQHPKEVVSEGETVEVKIEGIDLDARKISLSLAAVSREEEQTRETVTTFTKKTQDEPQGMGTFGDLLKDKLKDQ